MSVDALRLDEWWLDDLDTSMGLRKNEVPKVDSDGEPVLVADPDGTDAKVQDMTVTVQGRSIASLTQNRIIIGLKAFVSEKGSKKYHFQFRTGPETSMQWYSSGWVCTKDGIRCTNSEIGEYVQTQVWEFYGSWSNLPKSFFSGA